MVSEEARQEIMARLKAVEGVHNVKILFAVESGSRTWGFPSANSDYDVRFVYAPEPQWYMRIDLEEQRDVIELKIEDEIDMNGWDVRKALRLMAVSNPTIIEWLQSPIVYVDTEGFKDNFLEVMKRIYSPCKGLYTYRGIVKKLYKCDIEGKDQVILKNYLYVMRSNLAALFIHLYGSIPPINIIDLLNMCRASGNLKSIVKALIGIRSSVSENYLIDSVPQANEMIINFLNREVQISEDTVPIEVKFSLLNGLFQSVNDSWYACELIKNGML